MILSAEYSKSTELLDDVKYLLDTIWNFNVAKTASNLLTS